MSRAVEDEQGGSRGGWPMLATASGLLALAGFGGLGVVLVNAATEADRVAVQGDPSVPEAGQATGWDYENDEILPAILPNVLYPAEPAPGTFEARDCVTDDVSLVNHGWQSTEQRRATRITATNVSGVTCKVEGWPSLVIEQGEPMRLAFKQMSRAANGEPVPAPSLILEHGHSMTTTLIWTRAPAVDAKTPPASDPARRSPPRGPRGAPLQTACTVRHRRGRSDRADTVATGAVVLAWVIATDSGGRLPTISGAPVDTMA